MIPWVLSSPTSVHIFSTVLSHVATKQTRHLWSTESVFKHQKKVAVLLNQSLTVCHLIHWQDMSVSVSKPDKLLHFLKGCPSLSLTELSCNICWGTYTTSFVDYDCPENVRDKVINPVFFTYPIRGFRELFINVKWRSEGPFALLWFDIIFLKAYVLACIVQQRLVSSHPNQPIAKRPQHNSTYKVNLFLSTCYKTKIKRYLILSILPIWTGYQ